MGLREIDIALQGFTSKDLRTFDRILGVCIDKGFHPSEVARYVKLNDLAGNGAFYYGCTKCGHSMDLYDVNTEPGNQVGGNWKSQWFCRWCHHEEFSEMSGEQEYARVIVVKHWQDEAMKHGAQSMGGPPCGGCKGKK